MPLPRRFQVGTDLSELFAGLNDNFDYIDDQERTKIIRNGSIPTVLFGYQKGGFGGADYGLKVAKPGVDVTTGTDSQLAFNSGLDHLKVVRSGTATVHVVALSPDGTNFQTTITHGLGFIPAVIAFQFSPNNGTYQAVPGADYVYSATVAALVAQTTYTYTVSATTIVFNVQWGHIPLVVIDHDVSFKYYLLQESAN